MFDRLDFLDRGYELTSDKQKRKVGLRYPV